MYESSGNKHFFTKSCHHQTYQNSYFQSHFSVLKLVESFQKKIFMKNIGLGDQLLLKNVFENFDFLDTFFLKLCPIFVGSVHNFGKSDDDII